MQDLSKQSQFTKNAQFLLSLPKLTPNNGSKTDAAHPAIYPTGHVPKTFKGKEKDLYELIVRRFMACFGEAAVRETMTIKIDVNSEKFLAKGTRTIEKNWHELYGRFAKMKEEEMPKLEENQKLKVKKLLLHAKETEPPKRYTPASIIKELEKKNLGTKSTRAEIVDHLFKRGYLKEKSIQVTELGLKTVTTLQKYAPEILDEKLTRRFEEDMDKIREGKLKEETVLSRAKKELTEILKHFKENELKIGKALSESLIEVRTEENTIGPCPACKEGNLMVRKGRFGRFAACNKYPECKTIVNLPNTGLLKTTDLVCESCKYPMVTIINKGARPQTKCINVKCPTKKVQDKELKEEIKELNSGELKKKCPDCKEGDLVVRQGFYGTFLGCSQYPKCKHTEPLKKEEPKIVVKKK